MGGILRRGAIADFVAFVRTGLEPLIFAIARLPSPGGSKVIDHQIEAQAIEKRRAVLDFGAVDLRHLEIQRLDKILALHTKQDYDKVRTDTERDYFMSADEAQTYGIIDRVIAHH